MMTRKRANGEGTVYPRKNKQGKIISYRASYWAQTASGPKRRYVSGKTKTEAQLALRKATAERDSGQVFEVEKLRLQSTWIAGLTARSTPRTSSPSLTSSTSVKFAFISSHPSGA